MDRKIFGIGILAIILAVSSFWLGEKTIDSVAICQRTVAKQYSQKTKWLNQIKSDTLFTSYFSSRKSLRYLSETQAIVDILDDLSLTGLHLHLYEQDSLLIWTSSLNLAPYGINQNQTLWLDQTLWQKHTLEDQLTLMSGITFTPNNKCQTPIDTVFLSSGNPVFQFQKNTNSTSTFIYIPSYIHFIGFLALILFFGFAYKLADHIFSKKALISGASIWILGLVGSIIGGQFLFHRIRHVWWAEPIWPTEWIGPSVGDFIWQSFLLVCTMALYRRHFAVESMRSNSLWKYLVAGLSYVLVGLFLLASLFMERHLILQSDVWLQFDNIFQVNKHTIGAGIGISLWWISFFIFTLKSAQMAKEAIPRTNMRVALILLSLPVCFLGLFVFPIGFSTLFFGLILLVFLSLFDYLLDHDWQSLTWVFFWLLIFGGINAGTLYNYSIEHDRITMKAYAKMLSIPNDPELQSRLQTYFPDQQNIDEGIRNLQTDAYVARHYDMRTGSSPAFITSEKDQNITLENTSDGRTFYWFLGQQDTLMLERDLRPIPDNRPYEALAEIPNYRQLDHIRRYDYAVFRNRNIIDQKGMPNRSLLQAANQMQVGQMGTSVNGSRLAILYRYDEMGWVLMERLLGSYFKPLSIFAFFFFTILLLSSLLALANPWFNLAPGSLNTLFSFTNSLKTKIQLSVLALILVSSLVIAVMTIIVFHQSSTTSQEKSLVQRASRVRATLRQSLRQDPSLLASSQSLDSLSANMVSQFGLDVNIYNRKGRRIASSDKLIGRLADQHQRMNSAAFESLRNGLEDFRLVQEKWNDLSFKTVYVPLEERSILYLGIPYYAQNQETQDNLFNFLGFLFSIYAFVMAIAAALTVYVSQNITNPLERIREGIRSLRLGRNTALEWNSNDEIGELVREYNLAIQKLEDSTEKLRKSERENAWREMAKQVAHEIKNPLTPMKLRIQHLMRAYQQDPTQAAPMIKRVSNSLIEQIDTLTRIANEFSRFAQMPKPNNSHFDLVELLEAVTMLFSEDESYQITFQSTLSSAPVYADRDHLTRIVNNLIKNAIQSIPTNRPGFIEVNLNPKETYLLFSVTDNGSGIPKDIQAKVFSPNFTTKSSGTGLGLAMSRQMIEQAGGTIYFETEPDKGTRFSVEIPIDNIS